MSHMYPNLQESFGSEGVCPICLMQMSNVPKYACSSRHAMCNRCKAFYYSCPQCSLPLVELPSTDHHRGPPSTATPYPLPSAHMPQPYPSAPPSAPPCDFQEHVKPYPAYHSPSPPRADQELIGCPFSSYGCTVKCVPQLREMHVSRCQYRQHGPGIPFGASNEYQGGMMMNDAREPCRYQSVGCNVRMTPCRLPTHESICVYKDRARGPVHTEHSHNPCHNGNQNNLVDCCFRSRGCTVRIPHWSKQSHEQSCNYNSNHSSGSNYACYEGDESDCRWSAYGCRVRPKQSGKFVHEQNCYYRLNK